jgi:N-acetylated-alpha-linked acidic dipeptidase
VKTLPGVREGIEQRQWSEAEQEITQVTSALRRYASAIRQAAQVFQSPDDK